MVKGELWHEIHSRFELRETKKSIARALVNFQTLSGLI